jgi:ATPase subunit of ABC transporter with duplicated ATPase domains
MRQKKLDDRWGIETSAKGGRFKLNRDLVGYGFSHRAEIEIPQDERPPLITLPEPPELRFPGPLISAEGLTFRYSTGGKKKPTTASPAAMLQDINLTVGMGDRIGILGLNGAGKSTLIKLLVGDERPTTGTLTTHPRLKLGYYGQQAVEALQNLGRAETELTSLALLTREVGGDLDEGEIRGMLGSLGLPGRLASDVPICKLSGGQLVRCELARILWKRPHCLVLDEVTTHLDCTLPLVYFPISGPGHLIYHRRDGDRAARGAGSLGGRCGCRVSRQVVHEGCGGGPPRRPKH